MSKISFKLITACFLIGISLSFVVWQSQAAATITVNSIEDSAVAGDGKCTLREAITNANDDSDSTSSDCTAGNGTDTINFSITGDGPHTIQLTEDYPSITTPIIINGYSETGAAEATDVAVATLKIEIDGTNADGIGFLFSTGSDGSTVKGMVMNRFGEAGIKIDGTDNHTITGNYLGISVDGETDQGNTWAGIRIDGGGTNNTIGGNEPSERNILSGNGYCGVCINDATSTNNVVSGNYIGTDDDGMEDVGNGRNGVSISNGAYGNTVGGTTGVTVGGSCTGECNVMSGNGDAPADENSGFGINISDGAHDNTVIGNYMGTNVDGDAAILNNNTGVTIGVGSYDNTIGGDTAGERNIISGNGISGIALEDEDTTGNVMIGNYIGLNAAGDAAIPNVNNGVFFGWEVQSNTLGGTTGVTVGGSCTGECNVISGNGQHGIRIAGKTDAVIDAPTNNTVISNYIGTIPNGASALANEQNGINITFGASNNTIGGDVAAERNIISGNGQHGIYIAGDDMGGVFPTGNTISGNYIGTKTNGTAGLGNTQDGINIADGASNNNIGGTTAGELNVISGNGTNGITITDASTTGNTVVNNYIGLDSTGATALANSSSGIAITVGASNNIIGGTIAAARNIISGNTEQGVNIQGTSTTGNAVLGNYIGLASDGTTDRGNGQEGVIIQNVATTNYIGVTSGGTVSGNVISGNGAEGIQISDAGTDSNVIKGNYIGTDAAGDNAVANDSHGIEITDSDSNTIGGSTAGEGNVLASNITGVIYGISISGASGSNVIYGNYIGTDAAGDSAMGWTEGSGINIQTSSTGTIIGASNSESTCLGACNIISGSKNGINLAPTASTITIQGNYIGTDITGTVDLGNTEEGILINTNSTNYSGITIGGSTQALGNIIANSDKNGIKFSLTNADISTVTISHNIIDSSGEKGVDINTSGTSNLSATSITNNVIYDSVQFGLYATNTGTGVCAATINNNIISVASSSGTTGLGKATGGGTITLTIDFNDVYNHANNYSEVTAGSNDLSVDPYYTAAASLDFSISKAYSHIIDHGTTDGTTADGITDLGVVNFGPRRSTIYVDDVVAISYAHGDTSIDFADISSAISAAKSGDTVSVYAGTYAENVTMVGSITVDGVGATSIIIPAAGVGVTFSSVSNSTLSDFTISAVGYGVSMTSGSGNTLSGLIVSSSGSDGIYLSSTSDNTISGCTISNSNNGLNTSGGSGNTVSGNTISSNDTTSVSAWTSAVAPFSYTVGDVTTDYSGIWFGDCAGSVSLAYSTDFENNWTAVCSGSTTLPDLYRLAGEAEGVEAFDMFIINLSGEVNTTVLVPTGFLSLSTVDDALSGEGGGAFALIEKILTYDGSTWTYRGYVNDVNGVTVTTVGGGTVAPISDEPSLVYTTTYTYSGIYLNNEGTANSPTVLSSNTISSNGNGLNLAGTSVATSTDDLITSNGLNLLHSSSGISTLNNTDFEYDSDTSLTSVSAGTVNVKYKARAYVTDANSGSLENATAVFSNSDGTAVFSDTTDSDGYTDYMSTAQTAYALTSSGQGTSATYSLSATHGDYFNYSESGITLSERNETIQTSSNMTMSPSRRSGKFSSGVDSSDDTVVAGDGLEGDDTDGVSGGVIDKIEEEDEEEPEEEKELEEPIVFKRDLEKERQAIGTFGKAHGYLPENDKDWKFVTWLAYDVKPQVRNLDKERQAIGKYGQVYGTLPETHQDWRLVSAWAYVE